MFDAGPLKGETRRCSEAEQCLGWQIAPSVRHIARRFSRGAYLYHSGDAAEFLYVIRKGAVKSYLVSVDGHEQIVGFHGVGDVVGFDCIGSREFDGNAVAIADTEVDRLPVDAIHRHIAESDFFRQEVLVGMRREIQRLHHLLQLERCTAQQRVSSFLLGQLLKQGMSGDAIARVELPMTRAEMGSFLDLATETVSRVFTHLQDRGVIRVVAGAAEVTALSALIQAAQTGTAETKAAFKRALARGPANRAGLASRPPSERAAELLTTMRYVPAYS